MFSRDIESSRFADHLAKLGFWHSARCKQSRMHIEDALMEEARRIRFSELACLSGCATNITQLLSLDGDCSGDTFCDGNFELRSQ